MRTHTAETQATMTPKKALAYLMEGNKRFVNNLKANRNLLQQVNDTSEGQFPFATILSCIDSRTSSELVFDQGLGDVFSIRIAGNFINTDILGSMEFACKVAGSKLIVVLGHTRCGAIKGAASGVELGNLTGMLKKIQPAVKAVRSVNNTETQDEEAFLTKVADKNVEMAISDIYEHSPILREMAQNGEIDIVGGMYDVHTGEVTFIKEGVLLEGV
jgi:carbonic anhydrase